MGTRAERSEVVVSIVSSLTTSMDGIDGRKFYRKPTIHQIPIDVRKGNESAYTPKVVPIGPYNRNVHQGSYLHEQTEGMKILFLKDFLHRTGKDVNHYASLIESREDEARDCYNDRYNGLDSEKFVQMMVLDGCFIIEFLLKFYNQEYDHQFFTRNTRKYLNEFVEDLTLMENQIPFIILKLIFDISGVVFPEVQVNPHVDEEPDSRIFIFPQHEVQGGVTYRRPGILDLCLFFLSGRKITIEMLEPTHQEVDGVNVYHLLHLSYLCHMIKIIPGMESPPVLGRLREKPMTIPTATELNEFGVTFKRKKDAKNSIDVSFENGILEIPEVLIHDGSNTKFRNYLALEQNCPKVGNRFTSYAVFMDDLIDTASDVALLKKSKIIVTMLGSDEEIAKLFNGIAVGLVFNSDSHYLEELFEDVRVHCNKDHNRWRAMLTRDYFSSPWSIISLFGAFTLLAFSATQVVYAIKTSHGM